ncbi:MAG: hypothetical protein KC620_26155, partial [Myxococcales bacterium]|nr:hypothetical protein [Myxococcales bacterium]
MSQLQERRRSRGRGGRAPKPGNTAAEHQASVNHDEVEDAQTFWARSNARLGIEAENDNASNGKRGRGPVEFPCAVCGEWVQLERWPKDRHEVRCENCKAAVAGLLVGDDKHIAAAFRKARKA